jgi:clan AA aspartic protease (TIGR02281 family)
LVFAAASHSAIYKWQDKNGKTHFTDNPSKIPHQYRKKDELKTFKGVPTAPSKPVKLLSPEKKSGTHVIKARSLPGGHYMVEVLINGNIRADLMVDTGASMVILSNRLGERLGTLYNNNLPKMEFHTAGGKVETPLFILDSLQLGDATVLNVEASTNPNFQGMDGLLGMSFLGEFKMEMDRERSELILKPFAGEGDELWEGQNEQWWRKKYTTYAQTLRHYQRTAYQARQDFQKSTKIKKLIAHYEKLHKALEARADRANLPKEYRSYP